MNGEVLVVSVGREREEPTKGRVGVHRMTPDGRDPEATGYQTPGDSGSVTITGVSGPRLTLTNRRGATFIFDLASRTFVGPSAATAVPAQPNPGRGGTAAHPPPPRRRLMNHPSLRNLRTPPVE